MWPKWDKDGSGYLERAEAKATLTAMLNDIEYGLGVMPDEEFDELFKEVDLTKDGKISKDEMEKFIKTRVRKLEQTV